MQPEYKTYCVKLEEEFRAGKDIVIPPALDKRRFAHKREGIYIAYGPGIRKGGLGATHDIYDIAPTLLYMLGLPVAVDFDGEIMADLFEPGFLEKNRPIAISTYKTPLPEPKMASDKEELEEKLRAIGYIQN